jgi:REP element-mobilizing transposase RayT
VAERPGRRSIRLASWDYTSAGAYFVTICAYQRQLLFEDPDLASIIEAEWHALPHRFHNVDTDAFVIMPNHVHFVVWIKEPNAVGAPLAGAPAANQVPTERANANPVGAGASPAPTVSLGAVVGAYKSLVAVSWLRSLKANAPLRSGRVWQRNYYERIIRDEAELTRVREYIRNNPDAWQYDAENPNRTMIDKYVNSWGDLESQR